jgi:hypothetical protein
MPTTQAFVKYCLAATLMATVPALAGDKPRPDKVSVYFAAHEDDWQLFMNPSAFQDVINSAAKTVFVHVTAGDAGLGVGWASRKRQYYLARENGAETAIRFMADANDIPAERKVDTVDFNGHPLYRVEYRNTVSYFLRVPDGNPGGTGYFDTGFQSLKRLADGSNTTLAAVDGSTMYQGWDDLVATVRALLVHERGKAGLLQVNVAELDQRINPGDHSDHLMTAKAALDAVNGLPCVRRASYVNYASAKLPHNLKPAERDMESSVFAVTLAGILAFDHRTSWQHYDASYVGKNYFRVVEPKGPCGTTTAAARQSTTVAAKRRNRR